MGVVVGIGWRRALLRAGEWRAACPRLEQRLRRATAAWVGDSGGPRIGAADPELDLAEAVMHQVGGRVLYYEAPAAHRSHEAYVAVHRQLVLFQTADEAA